VVEGGIVAVAKNKCTGCKACIASCPYGARYVHSKGYVDKCTFCEHRVEKGKSPACVEACPTKALTFGDLADPESAVARLVHRRRVKTLRPEAGTQPQVFFLTL
jgi:Fe-S-cluster-containing dehydrogenase component